MIWQQWFLLAWFSFSALVIVGTIGKPRKPLEPGGAVVALMLAATLIAVVLSIGAT